MCLTVNTGNNNKCVLKTARYDFVLENIHIFVEMLIRNFICVKFRIIKQKKKKKKNLFLSDLNKMI